MKLTRSIAALAAALALGLSLVPALAQAQYVNYCNNGYYTGNYNCAPGTLQVYVQVLNATGQNNLVENPQNFTVTVTGINPSPASFPGSLQGTSVSVGGAYTVTVASMPGYTSSYSTGCQGTLGAGEQASCVVTESSTNGYYPYVQPYPYPYYPYQVPLTCAPQTQTVSFGQTATFTATGGTGTYTWTTPSQTYPGIGPTLNAILPSVGTQAVTVNSGGETATCTVTVVGSVYPQAPAPVVPSPVPPVTVTPAPSLPNTGFAPVQSAGVAFGLVALIGLSVALFPYVRSYLASLLA